MNNTQLQEAIKITQELAANKDAWSTAKELSINHLCKLYEIQAIRAGIMTTPRVELMGVK